jgi:hypothetical protein
MIIVRLNGGLGNQMFQYAAARRLAEVHNTELGFDLSPFESDILRNYELDVFNISGRPASAEELECVNLSVINKNLVKHAGIDLTGIPPVKGRWKLKYVPERSFSFDPEILHLPDNVYLEGYWQSERYFSDACDVIREDLSFKISPSGKNKEIQDIIHSTESISIHIRRGDYISNPKTNQIHGTCDISYYSAAVDYISGKLDSPHFFIFSDDPEWVGSNFSIPGDVTYIVHNGSDKAYEDMRLMSSCRHHIIANSSFSWWGAWLSQNPDKVVIAPEKWFNESDVDTKDLIPGSWIRL